MNRSFGFDFRDSLLSGTTENGGLYLFYSGKEYESIPAFVSDTNPTEEEMKFLQEKTNKLLSAR
jgi:hypothetical protein